MEQATPKIIETIIASIQHIRTYKNRLKVQWSIFLHKMQTGVLVREMRIEQRSHEGSKNSAATLQR